MDGTYATRFWGFFQTFFIVARTIADFARTETLGVEHLAAALPHRTLERQYCILMRRYRRSYGSERKSRLYCTASRRDRSPTAIVANVDPIRRSTTCLSPSTKFSTCLGS